MSSARCIDGSLKDASKIDWYNDANDDTLMLPPPPPPPPAHNDTLSSFICRSGCAVKPTEKVCETSSSNSVKLSAPGPPRGASAPKQAFSGTGSQEDEDEDTKEEAPPLEDFTDDKEENENEEAYQRTKNLGDQDCEDHKSLKKDEHSADLTMVFTFEKGCVNPHTQKHENGWWCEIGALKPRTRTTTRMRWVTDVSARSHECTFYTKNMVMQRGPCAAGVRESCEGVTLSEIRGLVKGLMVLKLYKMLHHPKGAPVVLMQLRLSALSLRIFGCTTVTLNTYGESGPPHPTLLQSLLWYTPKQCCLKAQACGKLLDMLVIPKLRKARNILSMDLMVHMDIDSFGI
ncbi:uncharacterized protein EDB93DRAFT_1099791 [Suillus bovinus]|uniref:uncharacterized protein n=1 Tax=Suillus bovinus TaxID=48563 RepID=UPI001B86C85D|nr:uncharacterized protein EDB93DRAFT_1099791 [Suillus bovinus]KAG2159430.1 hypothetical protein EDB93DRAFT_1099791 [Suillus bovinus]